MSPTMARNMFDRLPRGAACWMTRSILYDVESGAHGLPLALESHRQACLLCQVATVRQRQIMSGLRSLREEHEPLPYDMTPVLDHPTGILSDRPVETPASRRVPVAAAAVASVATVAAIGLVLVGRRLRLQSG